MEKQKEDIEEDWMPLESNPDVINPFVFDLGFNIANYYFYDLISFDEETQLSIPQPCLAVILCYPQRKNYKSLESILNINSKDQVIPKNIFYMEQFAENACGTIALFHSIINSISKDSQLILKDSFIQKFIENTKSMNYTEKGQFFQQSKFLKEKHQQAVIGGQSEICQDVVNHYTCFIENDGYMYELDGVKKKPINIGKIQDNNFLSNICNFLQIIIENNPNDLNFSVLVLAKALYE